VSVLIVRNEAKAYIDVAAGIRRKTLAVGDKGLMSQFQLKAGALLPLHSHHYEQIGYLVSGEMQLMIGEEEHRVQPGDSWSISANVPHGARIVKDTVALEIFMPVRRDYLD
jgi:quercetin dioxygenase-like cupin family protein